MDSIRLITQRRTDLRYQDAHAESVSPSTAFRLPLKMITVSKPSAKATQLARTSRYTPACLHSSAARNDARRYAEVRRISFTQKRTARSQSSNSVWLSWLPINRTAYD
jgi:hypothetical protein